MEKVHTANTTNEDTALTDAELLLLAELFTLLIKIKNKGEEHD